MTEIEKAWEDYAITEVRFADYLRGVEWTADRLAKAAQRLDELLESPEQRKLNEIRRVVRTHDREMCSERVGDFRCTKYGCDLPGLLDDLLSEPAE